MTKFIESKFPGMKLFLAQFSAGLTNPPQGVDLGEEGADLSELDEAAE